MLVSFLPEEDLLKGSYSALNCYYLTFIDKDIDAGPVILNLSSSGTAFALGPATFFNDTETRKGLLRTAEIAGSTITWFGKSHYLLANIALVGEAITLAMRTTIPFN